MSSPNHTIDSLILGTTPDPTKPSSYVQQILMASHQLAIASKALPRDGDYTMYMMDPTAKDVQQSVKSAKSAVAGNISSLGSIMSRNLSKYSFDNTHRTDEHFNLVKTAIGDTLEHSDMQLRLINKYKRNDHLLTITQGGAVLSDSFSVPVSNTLTRQQLKRMKDRRDQRSIGAAPTKPQIVYNHHVDNSYKPFRPVIRHKPNAITPLDPVILSGTLPSSQTSYPHPYKEEILNFEYQWDQVQPSDIPQVASLQSTPCYWIDTHEDLLSLERYLKQQQMFAIDLEHHSQHSYQGMTCLVQISSEQQDFIVDALVLRDQLSILNSSFTDPSIVKVLHGCNMDVIWLQRDLGLYLVNIFDTSQAARVLQFQRHNLASLLDHYCNITADKKYQLADWRQRPLNREMLTYAREDTHYLLHIYHRMKNELIDRSLSLSAKHPNIEQMYSQEIILKVNGLGNCASSNTPDKKNTNAMSDDAPAPLNSTFKVPFLLAVVLSRSNKVPLTQYEKSNRPVLAARKLFSKLRFHESVTPQASSYAPRASSGANATMSEIEPLLDDSTTLRLFCALYAWRDQKARELDEAPGMVLKNDYIINIIQNIPTTVDQLNERFPRANALLRPLIVPLFHLIQGVLQLPSELYNIDFSKLKFSLDPMKDLTAQPTSSTNPSNQSNQSTTASSAQSQSQSPTLFPPTTLDNDGPTFFISNTSSAAPATITLGDDVHQSSITTTLDPSIGLSTNTAIASQRTTAGAQPPATNGTTKDGKDSGKEKKKKNRKDREKDKDSSAVSSETMGDDTPADSSPSCATWGDDTIAQLEQQIYQNYDAARYAHPLYFLPDYLHTIINKDWKLSPSISDNLESDPQVLADAAGWGGALPEFPLQRDKLSRLNWKSAGVVLDFALGLQHGQNHDLSQAQGYSNDTTRPATGHGVPLFDMDSLGKDYSDSASNQNAAPITITVRDASDSTPPQQSSSTIQINPVTSERLEQHNQRLVKDLIASAIDETKRNHHFTTPMKFDATKQSQTASFHTLYASPNGLSTAPHDTEMSDNQHSSNTAKVKNPVARVESYSGPNSLLSPPRMFGNSTSPPSTASPQHSTTVVSGKLPEVLLSQPHSLDWDHEHTHLINSTPQIGRIGNVLSRQRRAAAANSTIEVSKFSLDRFNNGGNINEMAADHDHDDDDDDDEEDDHLAATDDPRIPDLQRQGIDSIPSQLQDIYKISNTKKSSRAHTQTKSSESNESTDGNGMSGEGDTGVVTNPTLNPFNPSQMVLGAELFKTTTAITDSAFLAKTGYTIFNKDQKAGQDSEDVTMSDGTAPTNPKDSKRARNGAAANQKRQQQQQQQQSTETNPFLAAANLTNNPFLKDTNIIADDMGTVYNPRHLKVDHKDVNNKGRKRK